MQKTAEWLQTVFLFDVDNTLLDNDTLMADLRGHVSRKVGDRGAAQYWKIVEELKEELGYADYPGTLQRCRLENPRDLGILTVSCFLIEYPFVKRLFEESLRVIEVVKEWGATPVILSDGDVVLQPVKVDRSGLLNAVGGNVLIYIQKEKELEDVEKRFPAKRYVLLDDKPRILAATKKFWGNRVTTVFVQQGHEAHDPKHVEPFPPADVTVAQIGDILTLNQKSFAPGM